MECPNCKKSITTAVERCDSCGYEYPDDIKARLSAVFEIGKEVEALHSTLKTDIWPGLRRISGKLDLLKKTVADDLQMLAPPEAIVEPEEVPELSETLSSAAEPEKKEEPIISRKQESAEHPKISTPGNAKKEDNSEFEIRLGQKWLLIVGIVTMVFGIGYFLKYSFDRGWIGPAGRVAMAYLWGLVLLVGGNRVRKQFENFGLYVIGGGIATLYFSTFAGFQIYHLFGQIPSFGLMIMITALACILSVVHDTKWLAVLGLVGGFLTPVMLSTGQDYQIALMTYIAILNFGLLSIAFYKKWDLLNHLGFAFTYLLFSTWFATYYQGTKFWPSIIFLNIYYLTYSIIPFAYRSLNREGEKTGAFVLTALNSFVAFGFAYEMIRHYASLEWVGLITISYALVSLLMAGHLYRRGEKGREPFVMFSALTALFLIITVPVIFSHHWITIFWAAQAVSLLWAAIRLEKKSLLIGSYLLLGLSVGKFLAHDYTEVFGWDPHTWSITTTYTHMVVERLLTSGLIILICNRFSVMLRHVYGDIFTVFGESDAPVFPVLAGTLLFASLNVETSSFFYTYAPAARFAAISVLWAFFSVILMIRGFSGKSVLLRKVSLGLFLITIIKVFLYDMANVGTPYRIVSFIILGILLVGTSYLYHRFKDRIIGAEGIK